LTWTWLLCTPLCTDHIRQPRTINAFRCRRGRSSILSSADTTLVPLPFRAQKKLRAITRLCQLVRRCRALHLAVCAAEEFLCQTTHVILWISWISWISFDRPQSTCLGFDDVHTSHIITRLEAVDCTKLLKETDNLIYLEI
jgi:hypothetical protein